MKKKKVLLTPQVKDISEYLHQQRCPICHLKVNQSDYLETVFENEPQTLWLANLVTHYRHDHITSWNKCWGPNGKSYRGHWFGDYDEEKSKYNERAKRQYIRKGGEILIANGVTVETFKTLQNTTQKTIDVVEKSLTKVSKVNILNLLLQRIKI